MGETVKGAIERLRPRIIKCYERVISAALDETKDFFAPEASSIDAADGIVVLTMAFEMIRKRMTDEVLAPLVNVLKDRQ